MLMSGSVDHKFADIIKVASFLTDEVKKLLSELPEQEDEVVSFLVELLQRATSTAKRDFEDPIKVQGIATFGLYILAPWGKSLRPKSFHLWCKSQGLGSEVGASVLSLVREFQGWEPASEKDFALVIELDRALIRGARVGAKSMNPESFVSWLEKNLESVEGGQSMLEEADEQLKVLRGHLQGAGHSVADAQERMKKIARKVLRDVGRQYGRSGLNSVRRQIGAAPSARRPSNEAIGATYSKTVYALSESYLGLNASEREAFKYLLSKLDTGVEIDQLLSSEG